MPNTSALPDVGCKSPVNIERVVVLPAPLCPNKAKIYPLYIVISTPFTAVKSPKDFTRFLILRHSLFFSYLFN
jgi:hypothetical protein